MGKPVIKIEGFRVEAIEGKKDFATCQETVNDVEELRVIALGFQSL